MTFVKARPYRRLTHSWCRWCCKRAAMKDMFKLRDGPLDWYFCDSEHALDWLEHRHSSVEVNRLLRMLPAERAKALGGQTIEDYVLGINRRPSGSRYTFPSDPRAEGLVQWCTSD